MCSWKQNDEGHKIIRQRAKATAAQEKFDREMNEYVQELIDTFEPSWINTLEGNFRRLV